MHISKIGTIGIYPRPVTGSPVLAGKLNEPQPESDTEPRVSYKSQVYIYRHL